MLLLLAFHLVLISFQVPRGSDPSLMEKAVFAVFTPLQHGVVAVFRFMGDAWSRYLYLLHVQGRNQTLERELFDLRQQNAILKRTAERLQGELAMVRQLAEAHGAVRAASVIGFDPAGYKKSIIIDKGSLNGVRRDQPVLDRHGYLVGRVVEPVTLTEATVQLITDEAGGAGVYIQEDKGVGVLSGDGTGLCRLKYIIGTTEGLLIGDEVLTSGHDGIFPRGIPAGKITAWRPERSLFMNIVVQPHFRFNDLAQVAVLLSAREGGSNPGGDR